MLSFIHHGLVPLALLTVACQPHRETPATPPPLTVGADADELPSRERIVEVVAGSESTCARSENGRVACIGQAMAYSKDKPAIDAHLPQVPDIPPSRAISAGTGFACSVDREGGRVRCWGHNHHGELGRATLSDFDYWALPVPNLEGIEQLSSLGKVTCARRGPQVSCWPNTADEPLFRFQLRGNQTVPRVRVRADDPDRDRYQLEFDDETIPGRPPMFDEIDRQRHIAGLPFRSPWESDSAQWCAMQNDGGFVCSGPGGQRFPGLDWIEVGLAHGCAPTGNTVTCVGDDSAGQAPSQPLQFIAPVSDIAVGGEHSCAVTADGGLHCWGSSLRGQVGLLAARTRSPSVVAHDVARVWTTNNVTCFEKNDGSFQCSGATEDPCDVPTFSPPRGPRGIRDVFEIRGLFGCIAEPEGSIWCLLEGTWQAVLGAADLSAGSPERFAALEIGELCWLDRGRAQCAAWALASAEVPAREERGSGLSTRTQPFGTRTDLVQLVAVGSMLCGLTEENRLVCAEKTEKEGAPPTWVTAKTPPERVTHLASDAVVFTDGAVAGLATSYLDRVDGTRVPVAYTDRLDGAEHDDDAVQAAGDCLLRAKGELRCNPRDEPWIAGEAFVSLQSAERHACAIDVEHRLWCWGDGESGQLGDGEPICSRQPRKISGAFYDAWEAAQ